VVVLEKDFLIRLEPLRAVTRDILRVLVMTNGFGRTIPNWGCTNHGNATKHRNQTEVDYTHDSVAVVCLIVKRFKTEDGMGTYDKLGRILYSRAEKRKLGRCED
jgi:hypothetical protein